MINDVVFGRNLDGIVPKLMTLPELRVLVVVPETQHSTTFFDHTR